MNYYNNIGYGTPQYVPQQNMLQMQMQPQLLYPQVQQPSVQQQSLDNNVGFIWVNSEKEARDYPVAPNTTIPLWDSKQKTIYLKSADSSGMPTVKIYDYVERKGSNEEIPDKKEEVDFATKADIEKLNKEIAEIKDTILDIQTTPDSSKKSRRASS